MRKPWILVVVMTASVFGTANELNAQTSQTPEFTPRYYYYQPGVQPLPVSGQWVPQLAPQAAPPTAVTPPGSVYVNPALQASIRAPAEGPAESPSLHGPWFSYRKSLATMVRSTDHSYEYESSSIIAGWDWDGFMLAFDYDSYDNLDSKDESSYSCYGATLQKEWDLYRKVVRFGLGLTTSFCEMNLTTNRDEYDYLLHDDTTHTYHGDDRDYKVSVPLMILFSPGEVLGKTFARGVTIGLVAQPEMIVPTNKAFHVPVFITLQSHLMLFGGAD